MKKLIKRLEEQAVEIKKWKDKYNYLMACNKKEIESMVNNYIIEDAKKKLFDLMNDSQDFKRGDVLIRAWLDGCVDYCRFKEFIKDNECLQNHFYDDGYYYSIYKNGKLDNFSGLENVAVNCSDIETLKFNWRKATQEEIDKLNKLLGKVEENKELEEAIKYLNGYAKGAYPIKPKLKKAIETILKHLDNENKK